VAAVDGIVAQSVDENCSSNYSLIHKAIDRNMDQRHSFLFLLSSVGALIQFDIRWVYLDNTLFMKLM